ncbi:zinc ribbon domain-containing protein [Enorma shizhengliae]|uniref:Zinc-ribbon domain-containing protein n=1 Tax=Enorma shizhengliae TaxID=2606615 RepID=A0A7K0G8V5_9ACTN|nr:zinc ribbon domain-containing protein [Enorma shizhengliae]MRX80268.1 zinc-ribbon domain-containing protein [Enorma shizhengliae]
MFCTNCGSKLPDDVKFCTQCGAPVAKVIPRSDLEQGQQAGRESVGAQPMAGHEAQEAPVAESVHDATIGESPDGEPQVEHAASPLAEEPAEGPDGAPLGADAAGDEPTTALSADEAGAADAASEDETSALAIGGASEDETTAFAPDAAAAEGAASEPPNGTILLGADDASAPGEDVAPNDERTTGLAPSPDPDEAERAAAAADAAAAEDALWSEPPQDEATTVLGGGVAGRPSSQEAAPRQVSWRQPAQDAAAQQAAQQPAPTQPAPDQPAPAPGAEPRKKKPVALIAGIAVLALAAVVVLCVFVVPRFLDAEGPTVTYGQTDPVQCSVVTRIRPRDAEGNELTSYVVSLVERTADRQDRTSADDGIADAVAQIRVTGNNGFTMEDFGDDIADGDYYLVIESSDSSDDSSSDQRIPIHYEHDNPDADSEVVVTPPAPESDESASGGEGQESGDAQGESEFTEEQLAYAHYYLKCQELINAYGPAGTTDLYDGQMTAMTGLALARLIDFDGDGLNELLVSYNAVEIGTDAASADEVYPVEVWDYQDGELVQVYEGNAPYTNGGAYFLDLYEYNDLPVICAVWYDMQVDNASLVDEYTGYFSQVSETLDAIAVRDSFFNYDTGENSVTYTLDGESATEEEWNDFEGDLDHTTHYDLALFNNAVEAESMDDDECDVLYGEDLRAATEDTFAELQEGAGDALEAVEAETEDAAYAYDIVEQDVTYTSSQGEGTEWEATSTWCHPQFTLADGSTTPALDSLNAHLKDSFDEDVANAQSWTFESGDVQIQVHRDTVTYHEGTIVCVRSDRSGFTGGAHGTESVTGTFYDLDTGQQVGLETATGVSLDELKSAAVTAVLDYVAAQPNGALSTDEDSLNTLIDEDRFYADENGVVVALWPYEIGSYADGVQLVYVYAFEDDSIVGTSAGSFEWGN